MVLTGFEICHAHLTWRLGTTVCSLSWTCGRLTVFEIRLTHVTLKLSTAVCLVSGTSGGRL
jgi:hypothetical protein